MTKAELELITNAKNALMWNEDNSPHPNDVSYALGILQTLVRINHLCETPGTGPCPDEGCYRNTSSKV